LPPRMVLPSCPWERGRANQSISIQNPLANPRVSQASGPPYDSTCSHSCKSNPRGRTSGLSICPTRRPPRQCRRAISLRRIPRDRGPTWPAGGLRRYGEADLGRGGDVDHVVHPPVPGPGEALPHDLPGRLFMGAVPVQDANVSRSATRPSKLPTTSITARYSLTRSSRKAVASRPGSPLPSNGSLRSGPCRDSAHPCFRVSTSQLVANPRPCRPTACQHPRSNCSTAPECEPPGESGDSGFLRAQPGRLGCFVSVVAVLGFGRGGRRSTRRGVGGSTSRPIRWWRARRRRRGAMEGSIPTWCTTSYTPSPWATHVEQIAIVHGKAYVR